MNTHAHRKRTHAIAHTQSHASTRTRARVRARACAPKQTYEALIRRTRNREGERGLRERRRDVWDFEKHRERGGLGTNRQSGLSRRSRRGRTGPLLYLLLPPTPAVSPSICFEPAIASLGVSVCPSPVSLCVTFVGDGPAPFSISSYACRLSVCLFRACHCVPRCVCLPVCCLSRRRFRRRRHDGDAVDQVTSLHTHTHTYIYIYIYVCMYIYAGTTAMQ